MGGGGEATCGGGKTTSGGGTEGGGVLEVGGGMVSSGVLENGTGEEGSRGRGHDGVELVGEFGKGEATDACGGSSRGFQGGGEAEGRFLLAMH